MSVQDALTDLTCDTEEFDFMGVQGHIHKGFLKSGIKVLKEIAPEVEALLSLHANYRVVVVGHSLGAAVASVLTILLRQQHQDWNVHTFLYAPPCVCSLNLCGHPDLTSRVTSFVLGTDLVPRFSRRTVSELSDQIQFLIENPSPAEDVLHDEQLYHQMRAQARKKSSGLPALYPMGSIYHFPDVNANPRLVRNNKFDRILMHSNALSDHVPAQMLKFMKREA